MNTHLWPRNISEAWRIQQTLKQQLRIVPLKKGLRYVAAADAAFDDRNVYAGATLFDGDGILHMQDAFSREKIRFDYIPGLLVFREGRAIISALQKLMFAFDLVLVDGQGTAHPEGFGIASHIGVILDIPAVGCAKSRLVGEYQEPGAAKGDWTYLYHHGRKVGAVVRTRRNVRPVFVSPGHLSDIESSVEIVLRWTDRYRIPEPLRRADGLSKMMKRHARSMNRPAW